MERLRFRSTSLVDLMAELHERDLQAEARMLADARRVPVRTRARRFGMHLFGARLQRS
jgi:hypothetical protein